MPNHFKCVCPNCQRAIGIPARTAPGNRLRCPLCQQTFAWATEEAATRTLEQAPPVTETLPPASPGASHATAAPNLDASQATFTLDPQRAAKAESSDAGPAPKK